MVGSGTLITFPTLLALGYPPVTANVSNNIGLVFGGISGTWGYRAELTGQRDAVRRLAPASVLGAIAGALLLLWLPESAFEAIVPALIAIALVLVLIQPRLTRARARRTPGGTGPDQVPSTRRWRVATGATGLSGVYGGYFGAAQGVLLIGVLGSLIPQDLQRLNALKNVLATLVNMVAAVTFLAVSPGDADPTVIALIAVGAFTGGVLGARVGRWLPAPVLRAVIVVVAVVAIVRMLTG